MFSIPQNIKIRQFLITAFIILILPAFSGQAQRMTRAEYIEKYKSLAIEEMQRTGIPASITLAQGLLESGDGNSRLAVKGNNHFGIKCHNDWAGDKIYHDDDKRGECFRKYKTVLESYKDHSDFLVNTPRYKGLFDYKSNDYKSWAKGLKDAGYATSRTYDKDIIKIIEDNKLYQLDGDYKIVKTERKTGYTNQSQSISSILYNNGVKYIIAKKGDTYNSIAKANNIMPFEVYKYNDQSKDIYAPDSGEIVYVKPKKNKAAKTYDFHIVKQGENLRSISQKYAVKLSSLYKMNLIDEETTIQTGDKIQLRTKLKPYEQQIKKETPSIKQETKDTPENNQEKSFDNSDKLEFKFEEE